MTVPWAVVANYDKIRDGQSRHRGKTLNSQCVGFILIVSDALFKTNLVPDLPLKLGIVLFAPPVP